MTAVTITNVGGVAVALALLVVLVAALPVMAWVERHAIVAMHVRDHIDQGVREETP